LLGFPEPLNTPDESWSKEDCKVPGDFGLVIGWLYRLSPASQEAVGEVRAVPGITITTKRNARIKAAASAFST
jgi:hypothetical protein